MTYTGDGNAFSILAFCKRIIQDEGGDVKLYLDEAMAGDYNELLDVSERWTSVDFFAYRQ